MAPAIKRLFNPKAWEASTRQRLLLAFAVVAFVLCWRLVIFAKGRHLQNIGRELGMVNRLVKNPVPNNAGTAILYAQSTDVGVGLYSLNINTGKRQTIYEIAEGRILSGSLLLLDWSPDDSMLAYAKPVKGKKQDVVLCSAYIGKKVGSLTLTGLIKEFRWLSPDSFAYLNNSNQICVATRDARGKWSQIHEYNNVVQPPATHFAAISPRAVAWKQNGAIWTLDVLSGVTEEIWRPESDRLISFYFSHEAGAFIVSTERNDASYQILSLDTRSRLAVPLRELPPQKLSKVNWADQGKAFAYQCADHWGDSLVLWSKNTSRPVELFTAGEVIDFKARGERVFIYGSEGCEPPGIWEYNVRSGTTSNLLSPAPREIDFAKLAKHTSGTLTNSGRLVSYQMWSPMRGGKRPVIIAQTPFRWNAYPFIAAGAGFHFVSVNRESWEKGIETWEADVAAVRAELSKRPDVNLQEAYLYGHSAETYPISVLADSQPGLWKGIVILSPTGLPNLATSTLSTMLIDAAELDKGAQERLTKYQTEAAKVGVAVKLVIHPQARHTSWSRTTEQAKIEELADYLDGR